MENYRVIPQGYMTVGELAKRMNITVRTLQYYDKEGLFSPSAESEGGRRLYTEKDMVKLYQILSLKYLGFSLEEIKNRLISLDNPENVSNALSEHAAGIREKIENLSESLRAIEALKEEVDQMQSVDFKKYADIVESLKLRNEHYQFVKYFDGDLIDNFFIKFDKESRLVFTNNFNRLINDVLQLKKNGALPESKESQILAKSWWEMVMEFTNGDMSLVSRLIDFFENMDGWSEKWDEKWKENLLSAATFIVPALDIYFLETLGYDPFKEEKV